MQPDSVPQVPTDRPQRVFAAVPGEDPWGKSEACYLMNTGAGPVVVRHEAFYAYARSARPEDFQAVYGDAGRELVVPGRWDAVLQLKHPIPQRILRQALAFLHDAWWQNRTEDILILLFSYESGEYSLCHPVLTAADSSGVEYERPAAPAGSLVFGSFHSHPHWYGTSGSATHSETDDADVCGTPGLHMIVGLAGRREGLSSVACYLATSDGQRPLRIDPRGVFTASPHERDLYPAEWLRRSPCPLPTCGARVAPSRFLSTPTTGDGG